MQENRLQNASGAVVRLSALYEEDRQLIDEPVGLRRGARRSTGRGRTRHRGARRRPTGPRLRWLKRVLGATVTIGAAASRAQITSVTLDGEIMRPTSKSQRRLLDAEKSQLLFAAPRKKRRRHSSSPSALKSAALKITDALGQVTDRSAGDRSYSGPVARPRRLCGRSSSATARSRR